MLRSELRVHVRKKVSEGLVVSVVCDKFQSGSGNGCRRADAMPA